MTRRRAIGAAGMVLLLAVLLAILRDRRQPPACCPGAQPARLDDSIASPPNVRTDTLANGLRYYVYANPGPGRRAELRLVVNAGSVLEDDDQRGLAHMIEHLAIRGTRQFPGSSFESYLESIGMRRGSGINATTSLDETIYRVTVPIDRPGAIDTSLAMLAGIANGVRFDRVDGRREGQVVIEEWRSERDFYQRVADSRQALLFAGTPYASRPVIGDTAILRRFDVDAMRRFYTTWYRPELMAVVVVGDFDSDEIEGLVKKRFAAIPRSASPRRRPPPGTPTAPNVLRASVFTDPEASTTRIGFWYPHPPQRYVLRSDYRHALVAALWRNILRARLEDASAEAESPISAASVERRSLARSLDAYVVGAVAMTEQAPAAAERVAVEIERLARYGASSSEVSERATAFVQAARAATEDGEASADVAASLADHFLSGDAAITNRTAYELSRDLLPTISATDVTAFARRHAVDSGAVLIAAATTDDSIASLSPDALVARMRTAIRRPTAPPRVEPNAARLLDVGVKPGRVAAQEADPEVRAFVWRLSNGMRVILKPTRFSFDEIRVRAVAPGGASLAPDADYASAFLSDVIIQETGVGGLSGLRLARWLETTSISMTPTVSNDAVTIDGSTRPRDLEAFFQLLHLYFTAPRFDTVAFRRYRDRARSAVRDRARDPDAVFTDTLAAVLARAYPSGRRDTDSLLDQARLTTAIDFWKRRVSNAAGVTTVITGDFTLDGIRPLVERYLASLPPGTPEQPRAVGSRPPPGPTQVELTSGIGGSARAAIGFSGPFGVTYQEIDALSDVRDLIELAVEERLRETLGATYYVSVGLETAAAPPARYTITVDFESSPERIDALAAAAAAELARLHRTGPTESEFLRTRAARARDYDGELTSNAYWLSELSSHARFGWPLAPIAQHAGDVERLSIADLREACGRYIPESGFVRVIMRPRRDAGRGDAAAR